MAYCCLKLVLWLGPVPDIVRGGESDNLETPASCSFSVDTSQVKDRKNIVWKYILNSFNFPPVVLSLIVGKSKGNATPTIVAVFTNYLHVGCCLSRAFVMFFTVILFI